jgi:RNAse (barnase) inhibitor barstar
VTQINIIWSKEPPWVHFFEGETQAQISSTLPPDGLIFSVRLDARAMRDAQGVFEQFSQKLQFPVYFGWSWDALLDCLRDFGWLPARRYLIVIDHADVLLCEEPEDRKTFFNIVERVAKGWSNPRGRSVLWGYSGVAFNVVLLSGDH